MSLGVARAPRLQQMLGRVVRDEPVGCEGGVRCASLAARQDGRKASVLDRRRALVVGPLGRRGRGGPRRRRRGGRGGADRLCGALARAMQPAVGAAQHAELLRAHQRVGGGEGVAMRQRESGREADGAVGEAARSAAVVRLDGDHVLGQVGGDQVVDEPRRRRYAVCGVVLVPDGRDGDLERTCDSGTTRGGRSLQERRRACSGSSCALRAASWYASRRRGRSSVAVSTAIILSNGSSAARSA